MLLKTAREGDMGTNWASAIILICALTEFVIGVFCRLSDMPAAEHYAACAAMLTYLVYRKLNTDPKTIGDDRE
jgi:hypothetical protein